jgi:hypothetical protein
MINSFCLVGIAIAQLQGAGYGPTCSSERQRLGQALRGMHCCNAAVPLVRITDRSYISIIEAAHSSSQRCQIEIGNLLLLPIADQV